MIDIVLKLTLIDNMVDLLSNTLNATIDTNLTNNELIVLALAKLETLVDRLVRVGDDIFQSQWTKLTPLLFNSSESNSSRIFIVRECLLISLRVLHVRWHIRLVKIFLVVWRLLWNDRIVGWFIILTIVRRVIKFVLCW